MLINDASITGSLIVNASASFQNINVAGNIIPDTTNIHNLGSTDKYFKEIYVSTGSINFVDGGNIVAILNSETLEALQNNTASANVRLGNIENVSASLQSFTASISATNTFTSSATARLNSIETISASNIARLSALETTSASVDTLNTTQNNRLGSLETISASNLSRISALETTSASIDTLNTTQNTRLTNLEIKTGSLATTGSNTFIGTQTITGSLFISSDLVVQGSSSLQNITASAVSIGTNIINLNTANPAIRYAGLVIGDSGSVGGSGSFLYDSVQDEMLFIHRGDSSVVTSSVVLMGPQTYDNIGNETYLTSNRIPKAAGNEHLVDSNISDDGTTVNLISRALSGTSATFSNNVTAVQGIFRNSGVPAIQAFRDLDVTSVGNAGQGIEFGARNGANYVVGATLYGVLENPATNGALALQTLTAGSLTTKLTIDSTGTSTFSSSVGINGGDFRYRPNGDVTNNTALVFKDAGNSALDICSEVIGDANAASRPIAFRVSSVAGGRYEVMRITSNGRVGMGTTNPQALLHLSSTVNSLRIDANAGFEIFITGSDSANIYHATPNQAIYLNTNGGPIHLGTSNASTLLTISGSSVGIGTISTSQSLSVYRGGASNYLRIQGDNNSSYDIAQEFSDGTNNVYSGMMRGSTGLIGAYTIWAGGNPRINVLSGGNVGIGLTNPIARLQVRGPNATGAFFDAQNDGAGGATFSRINASSFPFNRYTFNNGNVGINTASPLAILSGFGGAFQLMGDFANHQTIIRNAGVQGTIGGSLTITVPDMVGAAGGIGYGGFSCEVYVAGFNGLFCHAWFSGYTNGGITPSETAILRSSGGWSVSQSGTGVQGLVFVIDYPSSIVHPTARIIINKGGHQYENEYPANNISAVWS